MHAKAFKVREMSDEALEELQDAIDAEMSGLFEKDALQERKISDLPPNPNILSSKLVLAVKDMGTPKERLKARLVAMGN